MSTKITNDVLKYSKTKGSSRMALFILADSSNDDGFCWLGYETIAKYMNISRRNAIAAISKLCQGKEVEKFERVKDHTNTSNAFVILVHCDAKEKARRLEAVNQLRWVVIPDQEGVMISTPPGDDFDTQASDDLDTQGVIEGSPDPTTDPSDDPNNNAALAADSPEPDKKPRPQDLLFNAICSLFFNIDPAMVGSEKGAGGRIGKVKAALKATAPDATPEQVEQYRIWWDNNKDRMIRPKDPAKFVEGWLEWQTERQNRMVAQSRRQAQNSEREYIPMTEEQRLRNLEIANRGINK